MLSITELNTFLLLVFYLVIELFFYLYFEVIYIVPIFSFCLDVI